MTRFSSALLCSFLFLIFLSSSLTLLSTALICSFIIIHSFLSSLSTDVIILNQKKGSKISHTTHPIGLIIMFSFLLSFPFLSFRFLSPLIFPYYNIIFSFTLRTSHHIISYRITLHPSQSYFDIYPA